MTRRHSGSGSAIAIAAFGLLCSAAPVWAQGYGLYEQSACAMGRAGAGVAAPCDDGSSMYFNPAGLALDMKTLVSGGGTTLSPRGNFQDKNTNLVSPLSDKTYFAPNLYFSTPIGDRTVVGVGLFAPYGLSVDWPTTSQGRYVSYQSSVHSIYVQPTVAYKVNDHLLVGFGLDITHTSLELRKRVDLSVQQITGAPPGVTFGAIGVPAGTDFADVDLTGGSTHAGVHVGVIVKATDQVSIGGRYMSRQTVSFPGSSIATTQIPTGLVLQAPLPGVPAGTPIDALVAPAFAAGAPLGPQGASTTLPLPDQFVLGVAVKATDQVRVFADYQYTHWSLLDQIDIQTTVPPNQIYVLNFGDTNGFRMGAEYSLERAIVRAGFDVHGAAAPDESVTPLLPEASRFEITGGLTWPFDQHSAIHVAYMYVDQSDRAGRTVPGGLTPTTALNNGTYHYYANLFGASFVYRF